MRTSKSKDTSWYRWEEEVANHFGVKPTPGSGNQDWQKCDVVTDEYLIDCKNTDKNSYSLKKDLFDKYKPIAALEGKEFVVAVNLNGEKLAILPLDTFLNLEEEAWKYRDLHN